MVQKSNRYTVRAKAYRNKKNNTFYYAESKVEAWNWFYNKASWDNKPSMDDIELVNSDK